MKIKSILSIIVITFSLVLSSEKEQALENPSLKVTQLIPNLQQIVIDYMGYDNWKLSKVLSGHKSRVNTVNICAAKAIVASGSNDQTVKIWDIKTGNCLQTINLEGQVDYVSISPDGKLIVILFSKRFISVYNLEQNVFLHENFDLNSDYTFRAKEIVKEHALIPKDILENASSEEINFFVDLATNEILEELAYPLPDSFKLCSISPDNKFLIYISYAGIIKLWDLKTSNCLFSHYSEDKFQENLEKNMIDNLIKFNVWDSELGNSFKTTAFGGNSTKSNRLIAVTNFKGQICLTDAEIGPKYLQSLNISQEDFLKMRNKSNLSTKEIQELAPGLNYIDLLDNETKEIIENLRRDLTIEEMKQIASFYNKIQEATFILNTGDNDKINALALSADGKYLALAVDTDIKIWDNQIQQLLD